MNYKNVTIYFFLIINTISPIYCMESAHHESLDCFSNKIVFVYDGNPNNACYIAQTANIVHFNISGKELNDIALLQEKYAPVKNLIFTKPQSNFYDIVTIYNPTILDKKSLLTQLTDNIRTYLKVDGEIHALIRTQNNYLSIENAAFLTLYPEIYELLSPEQKQNVKQKWHPCNCAVTYKNQFLTDDIIKENIWTAGYDIIAYNEIAYENIMKVKEVTKIVKYDFLNTIQDCKFVKETQKLLYKRYIALILDQYKKNNNSDIIMPIKATKIHLKNKGYMRLRLNLKYHIHNSDLDPV